jgi:hypothetical protein
MSKSRSNGSRAPQPSAPSTPRVPVSPNNGGGWPSAVPFRDSGDGRYNAAPAKAK